jgi:hypothetical protein
MGRSPSIVRGECGEQPTWSVAWQSAGVGHPKRAWSDPPLQTAPGWTSPAPPRIPITNIPPGSPWPSAGFINSASLAHISGVFGRTFQLRPLIFSRNPKLPWSHAALAGMGQRTWTCSLTRAESRIRLGPPTRLLSLRLHVHHLFPTPASHALNFQLLP